MDFQFIVSASVERDEGKFASRDELAEQITDAILSADPGSLEGEAGGTYSVISWTVEDADDRPQKGKI